MSNGAFTLTEWKHNESMTYTKNPNWYDADKVTIDKIRGIVTAVIAGTDNGTITAANGDGDMATGVLTATAGDPPTTEYFASPTTNNVIAQDGYVSLTSAKATAGGRMLVTLEWTRTA